MNLSIKSFPDYEVENPGLPSQTVRLTLTIAGRAIATRVVTSSTSTYYYLFTDHLGSTVLMASNNSAQNQLEPITGSQATYYPFGDYRGLPPTQTLTDRGFTGRKSNNQPAADLGLLYYNARYYAPGLARFISVDTIVPDPSNPQQFNRYSYTLNNPVRFTDPAGHNVDCGIGEPSCPNNGPSKKGSKPTPIPIPPTITPQPTSAPQSASIEQQILGVTVQIVVNGKSFGHGVMIDENTLLTHNHFWASGITNITSITIYDASGNQICYHCAFDSLYAFADSSNGQVLDITEFNFTTNYFAGHSFLPTSNVTSANIGQPVALVNYHSATTPSGKQSVVVWATMTNTAYLTSQNPAVVPWDNGYISGLEVNLMVTEGASGGAAVMIINGQPTLVGVNSGNNSEVGYVAFTPY